jgi:hypothetical protein
MIINSSFTSDDALMYLIQDVTKLSTEEILGFFYDLGCKFAALGFEAMEDLGTTGMRKEVVDYFPNTSIPFRMLVKGKKRTMATTQYAHIEISFPKKSNQIDTKNLIEQILEINLLGAQPTLPPFPKPKTKIPRLYKDIIKQVFRRRDEKQ